MITFRHRKDAKSSLQGLLRNLLASDGLRACKAITDAQGDLNVATVEMGKSLLPKVDATQFRGEDCRAEWVANGVVVDAREI